MTFQHLQDFESYPQCEEDNEEESFSLFLTCSVQIQKEGFLEKLLMFSTLFSREESLETHNISALKDHIFVNLI